MSGNPWDKFFWNDWNNDPCLKICSLAARGLWMGMLGLAAQAEPKGYVTINGAAATVEQIASWVGAGAAEVSELIQELDLNGVFSRNRAGTIYSRKMVSKDKQARINAKNGHIGGVVSRDNNRGIFQSPDAPPGEALGVPLGRPLDRPARGAAREAAQGAARPMEDHPVPEPDRSLSRRDSVVDAVVSLSDRTNLVSQERTLGVCAEDDQLDDDPPFAEVGHG